MANERKHSFKFLDSDFLFLRKVSDKEMEEIFRQYPDKCILRISMSKKDCITFSWREDNGKIAHKRIPISIIENAIKNNENPIEAIFEEINKGTILEIAKPENLLGTKFTLGLNTRSDRYSFSKEEKNLSEMLCILFTIYYPNLTKNGWMLQSHDLKKNLIRYNYAINGIDYSKFNYSKLNQETNNDNLQEEIDTDKIKSSIANFTFFKDNDEDNDKTNNEKKLEETIVKQTKNRSLSGNKYSKWEK